MKRRDFIAATVAAGAGASSLSAQDRPAYEGPAGKGKGRRTPFKLKYAPHFGMFRNSAGDDVVAQLEFMADEGFSAMEDNWMKNRPVAEQERIAKAMSRLGMEMGVFVAHAEFGAVTFASRSPEIRDRLAVEMKEAVECAKRVNAKWCTVVPGRYDARLEWDYQTANVIDNLRFCAEICEPSGLTMVIESLNPFRDHPGLFLSKIPQAFMICEAVNSPSCKILDDLYHQSVTEGNLINNIDLAWSEIGYFQVGDNPGRHEPTTGEINYLKVFGHIHSKGFTGIVGMEHGNSRGGKEGERAVIDAYRAVDSY